MPRRRVCGRFRGRNEVPRCEGTREVRRREDVEKGRADLPEVIEIGGLALNGMMLTALISAFAGYGALWLWKVRARGSRSGPWGDLAVGAAAIAIFVWKFGVLFRDPSILLEQPRLLFVVIGSGAEAYAGVTAAGLFWIWQARRMGVGMLRALDALAVSAAGGLLAWNLLSAPEYRWGYALVCAALLALLIGRRAPEADRTAGRTEGAESRTFHAEPAKGEASETYGRPETDAAKAAASGDGEAAALAGYVLGAGCLAVSLFAEPAPWVRPPERFGLTSTQLIFIAAGLAAAALDVYRARAGRKGRTFDARQDNAGLRGNTSPGRRLLQMGEQQDRRERKDETYGGPSADGRNRKDRAPSDPAGAGFDKKNDGPNRPSV